MERKEVENKRDKMCGGQRKAKLNRQTESRKRREKTFVCIFLKSERKCGKNLEKEKKEAEPVKTVKGFVRRIEEMGYP